MDDGHDQHLRELLKILRGFACSKKAKLAWVLTRRQRLF